ncbi:MAG: hypothetical protein JXR76_03530 [Deltaproteobacteria bacterium]|nr:hypothetical protein [Deltaproteobacteria bacterium]
MFGFSCKGQGLCPSCTGRRMADMFARLVDDTFPEKNHAPLRQDKDRGHVLRGCCHPFQGGAKIQMKNSRFIREKM